MINKLRATVSLLILILGGAGFTALASDKEDSYIVQQGDTLSEIAAEHNLTLTDIAEHNPDITDLDLIHIGDVITIGEATERPAKAAKSVNTVKEVKSTIQAEEKKTTKITMSNAEFNNLAHLVYAEARGESYEGKVAVAEVVINRVLSPAFPNYVNAVIYQEGQFSPVMDGSLGMARATEEEENAVREALDIHSNASNGALYFYNAKTATNRWLDFKTTVRVIGNHTFKK